MDNIFNIYEFYCVRKGSIIGYERCKEFRIKEKCSCSLSDYCLSEIEKEIKNKKFFDKEKYLERKNGMSRKSSRWLVIEKICKIKGYVVNEDIIEGCNIDYFRANSILNYYVKTKRLVKEKVGIRKKQFRLNLKGEKK